MTSLKGARVLVTGAAGFIGANLVHALVDCQAQVYALVRPNTTLWRIEQLIPRLQLLTADLNQRTELQRVVRQTAPQIVFHLAFPAGHPSQPLSRVEMLQTGVLGTANLLEAVSTIPLERLVHLGSSLEYGPRDRPLLESDRLEPRTFRGAAKAAATLLCQQFARSDHCSVVVLRAFSVYGPWEAGTRLVPTAILAALRHHDMNLTGPGHRRDLVFVQDVVEACLLAVQAEPIAGEIINVGSGRQWANEEIVAQVQAISGQRIRVQAGNYPPSPSDTGYCVADIEKAKRLLGWKPRHTLQSGLEETVTWFRRHLDLYPSRREQAGD